MSASRKSHATEPQEGHRDLSPRKKSKRDPLAEVCEQSQSPRASDVNTNTSAKDLQEEGHRDRDPDRSSSKVMPYDPAVTARSSSNCSNIDLDSSVPSSPSPPRRPKRLTFDPVVVVGGPKRNGQDILLPMYADANAEVNAEANAEADADTDSGFILIPNFTRMRTTNLPSTSAVGAVVEIPAQSAQNNSFEDEEPIDYDSDGAVDNDNESTASTSNYNKKGYAIKEDQIIMDYMIDHNFVQWAGGTVLWNWFEKNKVFESKLGPRTWQSLKNVFLRKVVPALEGKNKGGFNPYRISKEKLASFKKQRVKAQQNRRGKVFIPPPRPPPLT